MLNVNQRDIIKATKCTEEDAVLIEELMRQTNKSLSELTVREFNRSARIRYQALLGIRYRDHA